MGAKCNYGVIVLDKKTLHPVQAAKLRFEYGDVKYTDSEGVYRDFQQPCAETNRIKVTVIAAGYEVYQTDIYSVLNAEKMLDSYLEEVQLTPYDSIQVEKIPIDPNIPYTDLFKFLKDQNPNARRSVALELANRASQAQEAIDEIIDELLYVVKHDKNAEVREAATIALGEIGPAADLALPVLRQIQQSDENKKVREAARAAIQKIQQ
jgi:HEAT repeat protein